MDERYIAAIDLGSARISLGVAQVQGDNTQIIYFDSVPSEGVRTGAVFNPQRCGGKIRELLDKAEQKVVMLKKGADGTPEELPFEVES